MLSTEEIKQLIDEDNASEKKKRAREGQRYYQGEHDIKDSRLFYYNTDGKLVEDTYRSNIRISHPFFCELSDQLTSYLLSFEKNPIQAKDTANGLQDHLDLYFDEEFWAEIEELVGGAYNKGFEYIHAYKNEDNKTRFECANSIGVIEVEARFASDKQDHVLYWYIDRVDKEGKRIKRIMDWDAKETHFHVQTDDGAIEKDVNEKINPKPHMLYQEKGTEEQITYDGYGFVPFWRLDNNKRQFSGLKPVKDLIDNYDRMQCGLSNNLADFDTPLLVVRGFEGDNLDELQRNIKTKKLIGIPESEGGVEVATVEIPYQARKLKADEDEKNIYRAGFGLNTIGLKDTSATTNVAIKAAYSLLEMKAKKMETRLKKVLKKIVKVVLDEINEEHKTGYQLSDVCFKFERHTMANETENEQKKKTMAETRQIEVNTILNAASVLDDDTILTAICAQLDVDVEEVKSAIKKQQEGSLEGAKATLAEVPIDGVVEPTVE